MRLPLNDVPSFVSELLMKACPWIFVLAFVCTEVGVAGEPAIMAEIQEGLVLNTVDSFHPPSDSDSDATECLKGLSWSPTKFEVRVEPSPGDHGDWLVRFPSPLPIGSVVNDQVAMEFYVVRDANGMIRKAPAIVVVHESGRKMAVGSQSPPRNRLGER